MTRLMLLILIPMWVIVDLNISANSGASVDLYSINKLTIENIKVGFLFESSYIESSNYYR